MKTIYVVGGRPTLRKVAVAMAICFATAPAALGQGIWKLDTRGASGPVAQVALANAGAKKRTAFVVFEYSRRCDPIFSFAEIMGSQLGRPLGQSSLLGTKIGVMLNGKYHTWHAAITKYDNGYEAGFAVTNELFDLLVGNVDSLTFVTPDGSLVPLPTSGFTGSVQEAFAHCAKRFE